MQLFGTIFSCGFVHIYKMTKQDPSTPRPRFSSGNVCTQQLIPFYTFVSSSTGLKEKVSTCVIHVGCRGDKHLFNSWHYPEVASSVHNCNSSSSFWKTHFFCISLNKWKESFWLSVIINSVENLISGCARGTKLRGRCHKIGMCLCVCVCLEPV